MNAISTERPDLNTLLRPDAKTRVKAVEAVTAPRRPDGATRQPASFAEHFSKRLDPNDAATDRVDEPRAAKLREAVEQLISTAFFTPLMEQARDSVFKSELFHGGPGEDAFAKQLDQMYADRVVRQSRFGLVESIERKLLGNAAYEKQSQHRTTSLDARG